MKAFLFFASLSLALVSCSTFYRFQPAAEQPDLSTVRYINGVPALQSQFNGASITADLQTQGKRDMTLNLSVLNSGLQAFDFFPENIKVTGFDASGKSVVFQVLSAEQFIRHQRNQSRIIAGVAAVAAAAAVVAVATSDNDKHPDPDPVQPCSRELDADFWYTVSAAPALVLEASAINAAVNNTPPAPYVPSDGLLRRHTLYPDEGLQGVVKIRAQPEFLSKVVVEIPVRDGVAPFAFDRPGKQF